MKNLRTHIIAAAVALTAAPAAMAVPAYPGLITVTQPDGTELEVRLRGDEYGHFYTTTDNRLVIEDNGSYYFAEAGDATTPLRSTGILATSPEARTVQVSRMLDGVDTDRALDLLRNRHEMTRTARTAATPQISRAEGDARWPEGKSMLISNVPTTGRNKAIVVLVQFQDVKFKTVEPLEFFTRQLMEEGFSDYNAPGSANDYFRASSRGQYDPQFDVYGPVTLANKMVYYGRNLAGEGTDAKPEEMVVEAVKALDGEVDFSKYDTDGDGFVDNITVIYAGEGEATSGVANTIWPHAAYLYSGMGIVCRADGVQIEHYNCMNEWVRMYNRPSGIGTFVHEFSHILGLPDLYDTDYKLEDPVTPGKWSVMDNGPYNNAGLTPPLHSAYESYCLGWLNPVEITGPCNAELLPNIGGAFIIPTDVTNEFYMFESRYRDGWDKYLPADGMLIWHIDYSYRFWGRNEPNNTADHMRIELVKADNELTAKTDSQDAFPTRTGRYSEFTAETTPAFLSWNGYDPQLPITDISLGEKGRITFKVAGGGETLGIDGIATDNSSAPVEWYTLQGVRVSEPAAGNIYIRRQGTEVSKLIVR